jgi:hypothetical protein
MYVFLNFFFFYLIDDCRLTFLIIWVSCNSMYLVVAPTDMSAVHNGKS